MSVNLFEKFSPKLDERYKLGSLTDVACGNDYDWEGVNSIKVYEKKTDLNLFAK